VPDHPELGFDVYGDIVYDWDYIAEAVEKIYGKNFIKTYNSEAEGAQRGVIILQSCE